MRILFTKRAEKNFASIFHQIERKWGKTVADSFIIKVHEFAILLKSYPEIGSIESKDKNIRGFRLTKQTRVIYRIKSPDQIIILAFFDVRQSPEKK
jgi:plasmid stabilization system protein ParE